MSSSRQQEEQPFFDVDVSDGQIVDNESVETLNSILDNYNKRLSGAKKAACLSVLTNRWAAPFCIAPTFLSAVLLLSYGLATKKLNAIADNCPGFDFQNNCNATAATCSTSIIKQWCDREAYNRDVLPAGILASEMLLGVVLMYALVMLCKNYSVTVELTQSEQEKIKQIQMQEIPEMDMKDSDLTNKPAGTLKNLIKEVKAKNPERHESLTFEGYGVLFTNQKNSRHLQSAFIGESAQPRGCLDGIIRRFTRRG